VRPDLHLFLRETHDVRDEAHAFIEFDQRDRVRIVEGGQRRVVHHHEAIDRPLAARLDRVPFQCVAMGTHGLGRVTQLSTGNAPLYQDLALVESLPEVLGIAGHARTRPRRTLARRRLFGRLLPGPGPELEQSECHRPDDFAILIPEGVELVDEVAGAEARLFFGRNAIDHDLVLEAITRTEVAVIFLVAVDGYDGGKSLLRKDLPEFGLRVGAVAACGPQTAHGPDLQH
jgi:hypothetical protein